MKQTILITGAAGFIGFHLAKSLLDEQYEIIGFDNINNYYDVSLKYARLKILSNYKNFKFIQADLADENSVNDVLKHINRILQLTLQLRPECVTA